MDKKTLIKLIITGVLVIILIFVLNNARRAANKVKEIRKKTLYSSVLTEQPAQEELQSSKVSRATGKELYKKLLEETKTLTLKRDPFSFVPIVSKDAASSNKIDLSGILYDKDHPLAIINGQIVKPGDRVGVNAVINIKKDRVILNDGYKDFELKLDQY